MSGHPTPSSPGRPTLGWFIATLTGGALLLNFGCSSTPDEEPIDDIEVVVPTQSEADAAAAKAIAPTAADAEYQKLLDEINRDEKDG